MKTRICTHFVEIISCLKYQNLGKILFSGNDSMVEIVENRNVT